MNKMLLLLAFIAFGINVNAQSTTLKMSPGAIAFGLFSGCYEKVISDKTSFQLTGLAYFGFGDYEGTGFGGSAGFRMYLTKKEAPRGFYLMPQTGVIFGESATAVGIGLDFGYQWIWESGFVLDIAIGPNYYFKLGNDINTDFEGFITGIVLGVGYAW
jgi:hypothetical protein